MSLTSTPRRPGEHHQISTHDLAHVVQRVAREPQRWRPYVRFTRTGLQHQLSGPHGAQIVLRTWLPSQGSGLHDNGTAASVYALVEGNVVETRVDPILGVWSTTLQAPAVRLVEPGVVLDLRGHLMPAVTVHVYAPAVRRRTFYDLVNGALTVSRTTCGLLGTLNDTVEDPHAGLSSAG